MTTRKPLQIFLAVMKALFLRELGMRFSVSKIGLFWTFVEPFLYILFFVFLKTFLLGATSENFDYAVFLALNLTAFFMFKNIVSNSMGAFTANKGIFVYKQVKPIDTIIARVLVEVFIMCILILMFISIGFYFNFDMDVQNLVMVTLGFLFLFFFSISFALFVSILNAFFPSTKKIVNLLLMVLRFASAVFFTIEMLPVAMQDILLYNPLVHFMEMIHGYYFYTLNDYFVDYDYMLLWTLGLLYPSLWFYKKYEGRIISQ